MEGSFRERLISESQSTISALLFIHAKWPLCCTRRRNMHISVGKMEGEVANDALRRTVLFAAHCWCRSHAVGCWLRSAFPPASPPLAENKKNHPSVCTFLPLQRLADLQHVRRRTLRFCRALLWSPESLRLCGRKTSCSSDGLETSRATRSPQVKHIIKKVRQ